MSVYPIRDVRSLVAIFATVLAAWAAAAAQPLSDIVSVRYADGSDSSKIRIEPYRSAPSNTTQLAFNIRADVSDRPVELTIAPGDFAIEPNKSYSVVLTSDFPRVVKADPSGRLHMAIASAYNTGVLVGPLPGGNLLHNGSFEQRNGTQPAGWQLQVTQESGATMFGWGHECGEGRMPPVIASERITGTAQADATRAVDGSASLQMIKNGHGGVVMARQAQSMAVEAGKEYLVSGWYWHESNPFGAFFDLRVILRGSSVSETHMWDPNLFAPVKESKGQWRQFGYRFTVPAGYDRAQVAIFLRGAPQTLWVDDVQLRLAPVKMAQEPRPHPSEDYEAKWSVEQVRDHWAKRAAPEVIVSRAANQPALLIDGKPTPLYAYNRSGYRDGTQDASIFTAAGCKIVYMGAYMGFPSGSNPRLWTGLDQYDFSSLRRDIEQQLQRTPDAAIMLYLSISPWFREFGDTYPDAVWRDSKGRKVAVKRWHSAVYYEPPGVPEDVIWVPSYTAEDFRQVCGQALTALAEYLKTFDAGKAVAGVHIVGGNDGQWMPPVGYSGLDYSPGAHVALGRYLREIYENDVAALRAAWGDPKLTFETAKVTDLDGGDRFLSPNNPQHRRVIDSNRAAAVELVRTLDALAGTFKKSLGRNVYVSFYYPEPMHHHALAWLQCSSNIDGVISVPQYGWYRRPGSTGTLNSTLGSLRLHGKLFMTELDYRNMLGWLGPDAWFNSMQAWGGARSDDELIAQARRDLGAVFSQGQGAWHLAMTGPEWGTPRLKEGLAELQRAARLAVERPQPDDAGQVAVFYDELMADHLGRRDRRYPACFENVSNGLSRVMLYRSGVSWDAYLLSDLTHPQRRSYKIYLFLGNITFTRQQIDWVRENLQKDGNILVFVGPQAASSDSGTIQENMGLLTGIRVNWDPKQEGLYRIVASSPDVLTQGVVNNAMTEVAMPLLYVDDPMAVPLGEILGTSKTGWAVRRFDDWTSVILTIPGSLTPQMLRNIVHEAGMHPVGPNGDVTSAGNGFVTIHALTPGQKTLRWPNPSDVRDLTNNQIIARGVTEITIEMDALETRWFHRTPSR